MDLDLVGCVVTNHPHIYIRLLFVLSTCNCREHVSVHYIESRWRCCPFSLTRVIISKVEWRACNGSQLLKSPPPLLHPLPPHSCPTMYSLDILPLLRSLFYKQTILQKHLIVEQMRRKEFLADPWFQFSEDLWVSKLWRHMSYFANRTLLPLENPLRPTFQITLDPHLRIYWHILSFTLIFNLKNMID